MSYVRFPEIMVRDTERVVSYGFEEIREQILKQIEQIRKQFHEQQENSKVVVTVECYPGVNQEELLEGLLPLDFNVVFHSDELAFPPEMIDSIIEEDMTDDPVFAIMTNRHLKDFFYEEMITAVQKEIEERKKGIVLIYGVGASLIHKGDVQIMCDITRWEIQLRYRKGMTNWRTAKKDAPKLQKYKRGYFAEWR